MTNPKKKASPILALCKKVLAAEVLFIIGYNILIYPYVNAKDQAFGVSLSLYNSSLAVIEKQSLDFGNAMEGQAQDLRIRPNETNAAVLKVLGSANDDIRASVVEKGIWMKRLGSTGNNNTDKIRVNNFTLGGDVNRRGRGTIPNEGVMENIRVGATARIKGNDINGSYLGTATMRVIYL